MARLRLFSIAVILAMVLSLFGAVPASGGTVTIMAGNFLAQFYNNATLTGSPVLTRADAAVNFSWGVGSPDGAVNPDNFSVRWTGSFPVPTAGSYVFSLTTDDGARLWVDGALVIDKWFDQAPTTYNETVALTSATHTIKVEYYEHTGLATVALAWGLAGTTNTFSAEYFDNVGLGGSPVVTRVDAAIDFDWGNGSPAAAVPADSFSARWTGTINFASTADYDFHLYIDDGARLYLDGVLILDRWYAQSPTHHMTTRDVTAGAHEVVLTYFEQTGIAVARLWWQLHGVAPDVIVDDLDAGFTKGGPFYSAAIGWAGHMYWTRNAAAVVENWGRWTPLLGGPGLYEVYVYIPHNYATTRFSRYGVFHSGSWNYRLVNQYTYSNAWVSIGTYAFSGGGSEYVYLTDVTGEPYLSRRIGFDAVKWVYRGP